MHHYRDESLALNYPKSNNTYPKPLNSINQRCHENNNCSAHFKL